MSQEQEFKAHLEALANQGKLVEAGWMAYRLALSPQVASQIQIEQCRRAFMAGATHLFFSIITVLDPKGEPNNAILHKMELIHSELKVFNQQSKANSHPKTNRN